MTLYRLSILTLLICLFTLSMEGQQAITYDKTGSEFEHAKELFEKEKYAPAIALFDNYLDQTKGIIASERTEAEFLGALSAVKLFNKNAEYRMNKFVMEHPESPLNNHAWLELAWHYYQTKSYRKAIKYFELTDRLELKENILPEYFFKFGYSHFMDGDRKRAMLFFSEIMDIDTEFTSPAIYYFSHIAYEDKLYRSALDGFLRLREDESFGSVVPFYIVQIMYVLEDYNGILEMAPQLTRAAGEERASELYRIIGDAHYKNGDYKSALENLEEHIKRAKRTGREGSYQLAYCYYMIGDYDKSVPHFQQVLRKRDELSQNAYYLLGDCFLKKGEKKLAQSAFSSAAKMDFDRNVKEEALFNFAKLTYETSYSPFGEVIRAFQEYVEQFPSSDHIEEAYDYLVTAYMKVKNYRAAITSLDRIPHKDERLERAYQKLAFFRGLELFKNLDINAAVAMFDKSLQYEQYDRGLRARAHYWKAESWYRINEVEKALSEYQEFMGIPGSSSLEEYKMLPYNMGYIYYNSENYTEALRWFRNYETRQGERNPVVITDVYNRIADCYYINTNYQQAIAYYDKVISKSATGSDYAFFQKGFALGLTHDQLAKVQVLSDLIEKYPKSVLIPNALFERGRAYVSLEDKSNGEADFESIISTQPNSVFVPRAMVQLGLLHYNKGENNKALSQYKLVIKNFQATPEARNALTGLKNAYVDMNDVEAYFAYVRTLDGYGDVSSSERDSLLYISGENLYVDGDCDRASNVFRNYLDEFAQGSFRLNANFYLAECMLSSGMPDQALKHYAEVANIPNNPFLEQTHLSLSSLYFNKEIYDSAFFYYAELEKVAELNKNILDARVGQLRSAYNMGDAKLTIKASQRVLESEKLTEELAREATFFSGKSNFALENFGKAIEDFRRIAVEVTSSEGAESKYRVAQILFMNKKLDEAENVIYEFIDQNTPHQFWMARMFILLADISIDRDDEFQARATLQSLLDYYQVEDDGIQDEVLARLSDLDMDNTELSDTLELSIDKKKE